VIVPIDVWLDDGGLVDRLVVDLDGVLELIGPIGEAAASEPAGVAGSATMALILSDYGATS
jgi:hypothetical protein